jgi:ubiquinone/menaquinone biosynthesis C-methylase UbiE
MKLNKLEFAVMNNPFRRLIQEKYELKVLRGMTSINSIENALEIGCGNGSGTEIIKKYFSASSITGVDMDEKMIGIAQKRNKDSTISFKVMDASILDFPDNHFDAVFDFAIIHHIPNWKDCLSELKRVLKPGGELILEDLSLNSFINGTGKLWRRISVHPYENMYTPKEFTYFLQEIGFEIIHYKEAHPLKFVKIFFLNAIIKK